MPAVSFNMHKVFKIFRILEKSAKTKNVFKNCGQFFKLYQVIVKQKNQKWMVMSAWSEACQKVDFLLQKSWFLCNTNNNYFCKYMTPY